MGGTVASDETKATSFKRRHEQASFESSNVKHWWIKQLKPPLNRCNLQRCLILALISESGGGNPIDTVSV
jgi:hypothetical protein